MEDNRVDDAAEGATACCKAYCGGNFGCEVRAQYGDAGDEEKAASDADAECLR